MTRARGPIIGFATQGDGHLDADRLRSLLAPLQAEIHPFDHDRKLRSALGLARTIAARRPPLVVMEGTGVAGGVTLLALNVALGVPFIVSSGDAVGPYLRLRSRAAGLIGGAYERLLYRRSAGFVGWTPYLVGRAITLGARRAMTAPGWARGRPSDGARAATRARLGVADDTLLVGLVGSLNWNARAGYTYGAELVRAIAEVRRRDVVVCIVGDGPGREHLSRMAAQDGGAQHGGARVLLPGRIPSEQVVDYLAAFDAASLPQSVDAVGSFRYSTKLWEYLAAGLPIITGQIPAAYDLDDGCFWRLPGESPWSATYVGALAGLLEGLTAQEIARRRQAAERLAGPPEQALQQERMRAFVEDVLERRRAR